MGDRPDDAIFAGTPARANVTSNIGDGDAAALHPRSKPPFAPDEVCSFA